MRFEARLLRSMVLPAFDSWLPTDRWTPHFVKSFRNWFSLHWAEIPLHPIHADGNRIEKIQRF